MYRHITMYTYYKDTTYMCMDAWTWTEHDRDGGEQAMSRGEGGRSGKEVRERGEGVARREGREGKEGQGGKGERGRSGKEGRERGEGVARREGREGKE